MPVPTVEPRVSILALIEDRWNSENIAGGIKPDFHTGWWNPHSLSAQVTFTGDDEAYEGASGYGGINPSSGSPVQVVNGLVFANCWAFRDEGLTNTPNPKQVVYDMAEEIRRIILANFQGITNLEHVSIMSVGDVPPEEGTDPMVFRKAVLIGFNWRTT